MSAFRFSLLIACLVASAASANWRTSVSPEDARYAPGRASISYHPDGEFTDFQGAIDQLRQDGHLDRLEVITLNGHSLGPEFEQEIINVLEASAPDAFATAREAAAAGRRATPDELNAIIDEAVLTTPSVRRLDEELRRVGRRVSRANHERLMIAERDGEPVVIVALWLSVEPI